MNESKTNTRDKTISHFVAECTDYIDQHIREFRYATYGLAILGTGIAIRSLRVFGRFKRADKIPKDYFKKNVKLHGIVRDVNTESGALLVEHIPIIQLFRQKSTDPLLPVSLAGVRLGPMGCQWLNNTTKNDKIEFLLLGTNPKAEVESIVTLSEGFLKKRCLNIEAVRLGMGQVAKQSPVLNKNKHYRKLYVNLLAVEADAVRNYRGIWFSSEGTAQVENRSLSTLFRAFIFKNLYRNIWNRIAHLVKKKQVA